MKLPDFLPDAIERLPNAPWTGPSLGPRTTTVLLFAGVMLVLVLATLFGRYLRWRVKGRRVGVIASYNARVHGWWIMVFVIALAFLAGRKGVVMLFAFVSFGALREFLRVMRHSDDDRLASLTALWLILPLQYFLLWLDWYGLFAIFIPVYAFALLPTLAAVPQNTDDFLARSASLQWGLMVCAYSVSHIPALLNLRIAGYEGHNLLLMAYLILVVQGSDVLQYLWGKLFGRHKLAPRLSPSKTVEGLIGGIVSASLLGALLHPLTPFSVGQSGAIALLVTLMGFFSGLVLSAVKRDRGLKDWGTLIEGHGGMLDRLDSMVFSAPLFFHIVRFWWA